MLDFIVKSKTRIISFLFLIIILTILFLVNIFFKSIGAYIMLTFLILISAIAMFEILNKVVDQNNFQKEVKIFLFLQAIFVFFPIFFSWNKIENIINEKTNFVDISFYLKSLFNIEYLIALFSIAIIFAFFFTITSKQAKEKKITDAFFILLLIVILNIFLLFVWAIINIDYKKALLILLTPSICDIFAYIGGSLFGEKWFNGKKIAPKISPNKTLTGTLWGIAFGMIYFYGLGFGIDFFSYFKKNDFYYYFSIIFLPFLTCFFAIFGDLFFSWFKRNKNIKDFSSLIPGHGGIIDRIDSIIFSCVFIALNLIFI